MNDIGQHLSLQLSLYLHSKSTNQIIYLHLSSHTVCNYTPFYWVLMLTPPSSLGGEHVFKWSFGHFLAWPILVSRSVTIAVSGLCRNPGMPYADLRCTTPGMWVELFKTFSLREDPELPPEFVETVVNHPAELVSKLVVGNAAIFGVFVGWVACSPWGVLGSFEI